MEKNKPKDLAYYLTMFKIKGHETWRLCVANTPNHFEEVEKKNWKPGVEVTDKKVIRVDRLKGEFFFT